MIYQLVEQLQQKAVTVKQACSVLGVSRSGYYANAVVKQQRLSQTQACVQSAHIKAAFVASQQSYGSRRLVTAMAQRGQLIGRYRARTLMKINHLKPTWKPKFVHTTDSKHGLAVSPNVLDRQFEQAKPNQVWVCDITYIRTRGGWLYLAVVLDLHSRKIVGTMRSWSGSF